MDQQLTKTASGLGYVDLVEGTGPQPKTGDPVPKTAASRITHVTEVLRMESDVVTLQDLFIAKPLEDGDEVEVESSKVTVKRETVVKEKLIPPAQWGVMPVIFMLPCVIVMVLVGILGFEMVQSSSGLKPPGPLTVAIAEQIGMPVTLKK